MIFRAALQETLSDVGSPFHAVWNAGLNAFTFSGISPANSTRTDFFTVPEEVLLVSACNSVALGSNTCTCDKPHSVNAASKASCVFVAFAATS